METQDGNVDQLQTPQSAESLQFEQIPFEQLRLEQSPFEQPSLKQPPIEQLSPGQSPLEQFSLEQSPLEQLTLEQPPQSQGDVESAEPVIYEREPSRPPRRSIVGIVGLINPPPNFRTWSIANMVLGLMFNWIALYIAMFAHATGHDVVRCSLANDLLGARRCSARTKCLNIVATVFNAGGAAIIATIVWYLTTSIMSGAVTPSIH